MPAAADDRGWRIAVEELLRWTTPLHHFRRTATRDVQLGRSRIAAGAKAAGAFLAKDPFALEGRSGEGLGIGVDEQEFNVVQLGLRDEAGGVATGAADAADFDAEFFLEGGFAGGFRRRARGGFKRGGHG